MAAASTLPPPNATPWSSRLSASRMLPSAARASAFNPSASAGIFSAAQICSSRAWICATVWRFRLNCRQRDSTVTGSFCGSVVANRNLTCGGGSSSVFKQRVERVRRQHVHLVDEVHLEAAARRRVLHVVEQLASVVDLRARRGVDLDEVDEPPLVDRDASRAHAARLRDDARLAVQCLREQPRDRGLADAARAGEQVRVVQPVLFEGVHERLHDVRLPDQLVEAPRPPFQCKYRVAQAISSPQKKKVRASPTPAPNLTATAAPFRA